MRTGAYGGAGRLHYGALGDAVNTAARLMMAAPPGQILVAHAAQQVCAGLFIWEELPPLRVKGKAAPLTSFRLLGVRERTEPDFYQGALIGRDSELEQLLAGASPIFDGQFAGICYVDGEAGIGKSRLIYELRQRLDAQRSIQRFYCPTDEVLRGSLHPFAHFLRSYFGQSAQASEAENKASFAAVLDRLIAFLVSKDEPFDEAVPEESRRREGLAEGQGRRPRMNGAGEPGPSPPVAGLSSVVAELERTRSFLGALAGQRWEGSLYEQLEPKLRFENTLYAVANLIKAESLRGPVLIELEDGHWLDADSQGADRRAEPHAAGLSSLLVCAARPDDEGRPFRLNLAGGTPKCAIDLGALAPDGVRALAAQALGADVSEELATFLFDKTAGNPLFVEQLALDLRERGFLKSQECTPGGSTKHQEVVRGIGFSALSSRFLNEVPAGVNAVLVTRIDRLAPPVKEVVQTAAVLGREWPLQVLWGMLRDDRSLPAKVRQAEQGQVWAHMGQMRYLFRHVPLRDAAYDMQARARLRELHARAAQAIETEFGRDLASYYASLAHHYEQAELRSQARRFLELAADQAKENYRNREALALYDRLLPYLEDRAEVISVLTCKALILELIGDWIEAERLYQEGLTAARQLGRIVLIAEKEELLGRLLRKKARHEEAFDLLNAAKTHYVAQNDIRGMSHVIDMLAYYTDRHGEHTKALALWQKALKLAEEASDTRISGQILNSIGTFHFMKGNYLEALPYYQQALDLAEQHSYTPLLARSLDNIAGIYFYLGDYARSLAYVEQSLTLSESIGDIWSTAVTLQNLGELLIAQGEYDQARVCFERAIRLDEWTGNFSGVTISSMHMGNTSKRMAQYIRAEAWYDRAIMNLRQESRPALLSECLYQKADLFFILERFEEARTLNRQAGSLAEQHKLQDTLFSTRILTGKLYTLHSQTTSAMHFQTLLHEYTNTLEVATLNYELWKLTGETSYREASAELYRTLLAKTPNIEYKERLAELEAIKSNSAH
jgi:predicted ATPase